MIDRKQLLADLKPLLKEVEADLRARCDEVAQINEDLKKEYEQARAADRTGVTFEEWRADLITQVAVAWVLSCVFVRFLEDNALIAPPRISGPLSSQQSAVSGQQSAVSGQQSAVSGQQSAVSGQQSAVSGSAESCLLIADSLSRARDERETYFKTHPRETDRDYLLAVFDDLAKLPGTKDVFGPHNPVSAYRNWLSGDAAQKLIEFFQKIDTDGTGEIIHDFASPQPSAISRQQYKKPDGSSLNADKLNADSFDDTRFLGDLYQDLSEAARKKYALLQTPIFVEEFILERTLEPAIKEFGLDGKQSAISDQQSAARLKADKLNAESSFKMIDPACGSGHFLLGAFARILKHWRAKEPGTNERELVNRALASVHGVDLNPYAVAIARFRLLVAAMRECQITKLEEAPAFAFNLVCGDSLLHGAPGTEQQLLGFHELAHVYQSEDLPELRRILKPGQYHAVVANPPYITVKDKALNVAYRERYPEVCHMKYSLAVPFLQRLFVLACPGGFTGQITANSFMKREFGKKLVESYLPKIDLTHVIDTSGAYIPGHGTPTVILFGRQRKPVAPTLRAVMGIKGEPATPDDPAQGLVWSAILDQIDRIGSQSAFVSVNDTPREQFGKHPWSIGGGGAAELKEQLDETGIQTIGDVCESIGFVCITKADEFFQQPETALRRKRGRLESYCDLDGRMNESDGRVGTAHHEPPESPVAQTTADGGRCPPYGTTAIGELREPRLTSVAKVADLARADKDFMQVAEIFTGRMDFDVGSLVGELVAAESVPALPVLRYKPAAMDKRAAWERTWDLQRLEDAVDALFEVERLKKLSAVSGQGEAVSGQRSAVSKTGGDGRSSKADSCKLIADSSPESCKLSADSLAIVLREAVSAAGYVAEALKQKLNLTSDTILKPVQDAAKRAKKAAVGDIPVPPKYTSADFLSSNFWRLRGKLDVPKERWVSFPHCEGEDGTLVIAWAGYDHLQLARAVAERYELAKEQEGRKLVPLLATIGQLIPWLKQWHNELDPAFGTRMGDYFEGYLAEEAKALGMSVDQVMAWTPPEKPKKPSRKKK